MRARNPLYVMAKPPPEVQAAIAALPRNDPGRSPDLLHVTLISLYDLDYAPPEWLPATIAALDGFAAAPFPLRFDRIENRKAVTLRTRDPLAGARAFQKALVDHLLREKAPIMDGKVRRFRGAPNRTSPKNVRRQLSRRPAECPKDAADRLDGRQDHPDRKHRWQDHPCRPWPLAAVRRRLTPTELPSLSRLYSMRGATTEHAHARLAGTRPME